MQFNIFAKIAVLSAVLISNTGPAAAAPSEVSARANGHAIFLSKWTEGTPSYQPERYRFSFTGVDGSAFQFAFLNCGGIARNFQTWTDASGANFFDDSENTPTNDQVIVCGIQRVTGQTCPNYQTNGFDGCYGS